MSWFDPSLDAASLLYAVLFFPVPFFWLIFHPFIGFWRRFGKQAYWIALPVWVLSGVTVVSMRGWLFAARIERSFLTWLLSAGLIIVAIWIDRHVEHAFSWRRLIGIPEIDRAGPGAGVVRTGIYAHIRHPRYLEFMLSFLGLAFLTGAQGIFLLAIATILLYLIVAPLEERELRQSYGVEYDAYAREVPRFLPCWRRKSKPQTSS